MESGATAATTLENARVVAAELEGFLEHDVACVERELRTTYTAAQSDIDAFRVTLESTAPDPHLVLRAARIARAWVLCEFMARNENPMYGDELRPAAELRRPLRR
jgi:hypothetical protein